MAKRCFGPHTYSKVRTCVIALGIAAVPAFANAAVPPVPAVAGPIPATVPLGDPSHNYPFFASQFDLLRYRYVEQEYFISGTANRYSIPAAVTGNTPPTGAASVIDSGHPFTTRIVVRRPVSPKQFNGTVIVEWYNVTNGFDSENDWFQSYDHLMDAGYIWVGVSAQRVGVNALKAWSPSRYGQLDVTQGGQFTNDELSYDIFSSAIEAITDPHGIAAQGGFDVRKVIATGHSQSAIYLSTYADYIEPMGRVLDGIVLHSGGQAIRTDLDIPIWRLNVETDLLAVGQYANRQPDTPRYRTWEVAGASHTDERLVEGREPLTQRDRQTSQNRACDLTPFSRVPYHYVLNAVYDQMVRWTTVGIAPRSAPPIQVVSGNPVTIARDSFGNALGGIRLPELAVPTATQAGNNSGSGLCILYGNYEPFSQDVLDALYPSHADYVGRVTASAFQNLQQRYIEKPDAAQIILDALKSDIGSNRPGMYGSFGDWFRPLNQ